MAEALEDMTPLERRIHDALVSAFMLANYGELVEVVQQIKEVEILRETMDLEDRSLLPLAEAGLIQLISCLPVFGET